MRAGSGKRYTQACSHCLLQEKLSTAGSCQGVFTGWGVGLWHPILFRACPKAKMHLEAAPPTAYNNIRMPSGRAADPSRPVTAFLVAGG